MRYIDSGHRDPNQALGTWIMTFNPEAVTELRFQTGFFSAGAIALLNPVLTAQAIRDGVVRGVIGSNDAGTSRDDVLALAKAVGIPRARAGLGVCSFGAGFFHPKVIHVRTHNGRQRAYVGSANLTPPGLGLHVEAGIILDTEEGDSASELDRIAEAVDAWFTIKRPGFFSLHSIATIDELVAKGVLARESVSIETSPPKRRSETGESPELPKLEVLIRLPTGLKPGASTSASDVGEDVVSGAGDNDAPADVYLMELSKNRGGNSYQAELTKQPFLDFFGGTVGGSINIRLTQVKTDGSRTIEHRQLVNVKSNNYRVEIGAFAGKTYPAGSNRPIVAFRYRAEHSFDYMLLMPEDFGYFELNQLLAKFAAGASTGKLRRATISTGDLRSEWSGSPLLA